VFFAKKISRIQLTFNVFHVNLFVITGTPDGHILDVHNVAHVAGCPSLAPVDGSLVLFLDWHGLVCAAHAEVLPD
jgi:hypothetical protein